MVVPPFLSSLRSAFSPQDGTLQFACEDSFASAYGDAAYGAELDKGRAGADHSDPNERFRAHTEAVKRGGNTTNWDSSIQYDAVDKWDNAGGAVDTRSASRDQNRYGTSAVALETGEVAQRKTAITSMMDSGVTRDEEGIDRVPDPPDSLKPYLKFFKTMARGEGIDMELMMLGAGGTRYGTISKTAFQSQLTSYFKRFTFSDQLLFSLCHAYGTGAEDIFNGGYELVAWRDFVEDVEKAYPDKDDGYSESQVGRGDQWIPDDGSTVVGKL